MTDDDKDKLWEAIDKAASKQAYAELSLGWMRYEAVRKLSAREFADIFQRVVREGTFFDDIIDALILERIGKENE